MATEQCPICGEHVPFSNTVHVMLNPRDEGGVIDFYVCRECYETDIEPLFADAIAAAAADEEAAESEDVDDPTDGNTTDGNTSGGGSTDQDEAGPADGDGPESADSAPPGEATPDASSSSE